MYGKIFDSMYDGTISANWKALVTFQQMIVLCDADGTIDMTPPALSRRTGIPLEIIEEGIAYLEQPDPYSRSDAEEGRRIIRLDEHRPWGWSIVNHEYYKTLQDSDTVREQNKIRKRRQRAKQSQNVTDGHAQSRHTNTDTDKTYTCKFDAFWGVYPKKRDKAKAAKVFKRLSAEDQQSAINDVSRRTNDDPQWRKDNGEYIPLPSTYLNNRRWEDEWESAPVKSEPMSRAERAARAAV